jgi:hypothetical protein
MFSLDIPGTIIVGILSVLVLMIVCEAGVLFGRAVNRRFDRHDDEA